MWARMREALAPQGIESLYIASHHQNKRAHAVAEHHLGFHRVDIYPAFARCQGEATDFLILSMRQEDIPEAWTLAHERAERQVRDYKMLLEPHDCDHRSSSIWASSRSNRCK
jgi:hypothetical protein